MLTHLGDSVHIRAVTRVEQDSEALVTELAAAWLQTHRSWNTRAAYEADLAWFARWCSQSGCSPLRVAQGDVERCCADSEAQGDGAAVTRRRLAALTSFFDHAVTAGDMADNPAEQVERPIQAAVSPPVELDECEAQALLEAAADLGPKATVLVALLLVDGLKLGEALTIDIEDLGDDPSTVTVTRQSRRESLGLHGTTAAAIDTYAHGRSAGPLLAGNDAAGSRLTRSGAHQILKRASTNAGITKSVSANTLRRYFASSAYRDGATVDQIRARLGVGERRTTRRLLPQHP